MRIAFGNKHDDMVVDMEPKVIGNVSSRRKAFRSFSLILVVICVAYSLTTNYSDFFTDPHARAAAVRSSVSPDEEVSPDEDVSSASSLALKVPPQRTLCIPWNICDGKVKSGPMPGDSLAEYLGREYGTHSTHVQGQPEFSFVNHNEYVFNELVCHLSQYQPLHPEKGALRFHVLQEPNNTQIDNVHCDAMMGLGQSFNSMARILGAGLAIPLLKLQLFVPYGVGALMMIVGAMFVFLARPKSS